MKKYIKIIVLAATFAIAFFGLAINSYAAKPSDYGLKEGDLISAIFSDDPDVYIINDSGYKRLFLNPTIFNFYGHLGGFFNVKLVPTEVRDAFVTSGLFRNCESNDPKVYGIDIDGEDTGKLHWVNVSAENASSEDQDFFKKVFCINNNELNWYPKGSEFKAVKDVPKYARMKGKEKLSTQEKIAENAEIKGIGQTIICHYPPGNPAAYQTITVGTPALKAHLDHGDVVGACPTAPTQDKIPPIISSVNVTNITYSSATITWSTDESSDSQVQYGLTVNYTSSTALNTSMVASHLVVLSDLNPLTIYHYRVESKDVAGNLAVSEDHTFTTNTLSTDTTAPLVPTGLTAVVASSSQINLSWTASTDNVGVTGYRIYRGGVHINNSTLNSYSDTGLSPSVTYTYTVAAYDAAGNVSSQSNSASAIPQEIIYLYQSGGTVILGSLAYNVSGSTFNFSFTATAPIENDWYALVVGEDPFAHPETAVILDYPRSLPNPITITKSVELNLDIKEVQVWLVHASDIVTDGRYTRILYWTNWDPEHYLFKNGSFTAADTVAPSTPTNLSATVVSPYQVNLSWAASTDIMGVVGYRIYRGGTQIATSTTNSYSNTGLSPSTTYAYTVAAYDAASNISGQSSQTSATTQQAETGLVGYWPFESNANDLSGTGNNGTNLGATFVNGMKGQALYFNENEGDYVTIPDNSSLDLANEFTLEAWIYPESTGDVVGDAGNRVISKRGSGSGFVLSAGKLESWEENGHNHDLGRVYKSGIGRWYYLVATKDDTETQSTISVYINGELVEQRTENKYYIALNNQPVTIGVDIGGHYFQGIIDEVKVYNRALTPQEILQNYQLTYSEPTYNRADFTPPQITNIQTTNITQNSATITWTTDELSNSVVTIGSSEMFYAPYLAGDIDNDYSSDSNVLSHSILADGLTSGRIFYYKVASLDVNGNSIWSETKSFVTQ